jgi:hypothetical protein
MTIRIPKALLLSVAVAALVGCGLVAGYLVGRESRAADTRNLRALRAELRMRNADDAVQQANTITRLQNACRVAVRFPNKVGTPFSPNECNAITPFGKLITPASFEQAVWPHIPPLQRSLPRTGTVARYPKLRLQSRD